MTTLQPFRPRPAACLRFSTARARTHACRWLRACSVRMEGMRCIRYQVTYAVIDPHVMAVSSSPLIVERTVAVHVLTDKPLTQAYPEYPASFYPTSTPVCCSTM